MGFLFRNANFQQYIQNGFTFHFKLSGQIIYSNLHSFCVSSRYFRYTIISTSRL
jgi:hypothetical protein